MHCGSHLLSGFGRAEQHLFTQGVPFSCITWKKDGLFVHLSCFPFHFSEHMLRSDFFGWFFREKGDSFVLLFQIPNYVAVYVQQG